MSVPGYWPFFIWGGQTQKVSTSNTKVARYAMVCIPSIQTVPSVSNTIIRDPGNLGQHIKPGTVCSKQVMFYLETCILTLYIHHTHPHRPHCSNKAITVLAHRPPSAPAPCSVPSRVRHCRSFMTQFCSKRAWGAPIDAFPRLLNARPGSAVPHPPRTTRRPSGGG